MLVLVLPSTANAEQSVVLGGISPQESQCSAALKEMDSGLQGNNLQYYWNANEVK